jgi:hypothetical protein
MRTLFKRAIVGLTLTIAMAGDPIAGHGGG